MPARDQQREKWVRRRFRAIEECGEDVAVKMIDRIERLGQRECERLRGRDADDEAADQTGSAGYRNSVEIGERECRALERIFNHGREEGDVTAARDLRNDAAVFRVKRVLVRCDVRK